MTAYRDLFAALAYPFREDEVQVLPKAGGQLFARTRVYMNRFDEVLGPENWWDDYVPSKDSVLCRLSIRLPDGRVLTKSDAGGYAGMAKEEDDQKSGFSDAFKRAAVKFGVGRFMYKYGLPDYAMTPEDAKRRGIVLHRVVIRSSAEDTYASCQEQADTFGDPNRVDSEVGEAPRSASVIAETVAPSKPAPAKLIPLGRQPCNGKELWAWASATGTELGLDLTGMILDWAKGEGRTTKVIEWTEGLVSEAFSRIAGELDRLGKVEISEEARAQMAIVPSILSGKGPLTIDSKDPLRVQKVAIKDLAKQLCSDFLGKDSQPTEQVVMAYIQARQKAHNQRPLQSLRDCNNKRSLEELMEALREDQEDVARLS